jgi:hypothetical protein
MALKRAGDNTSSEITNRAETVFAELARKRERGEINTTKTISFRLLDSERNSKRTRLHFGCCG